MLNKLFKSGRKNDESSSNAIAGRYRLIDSLRGLAVVNMVIFHLLYDMVGLLGKTTTKQWFHNHYWDATTVQLLVKV